MSQHFHIFLANENRYEGTWKDDKKNGPGKFYYLTHGQIYEGIWLEDVAKCGTMKDFDRENAPEPTQYPIPKVSLVNFICKLTHFILTNRILSGKNF